MERVGDELILYDRRTDELHCLSPAVAAIFEACDGTRSPGELSRLLPGDNGEPERGAIAAAALAELQDKKLVSSAQDQVGGTRALSRRELLEALGIAVPFILTVLAPAPAQAASCFGSGHPCQVGHKECCGTCVNGRCS